MPGDHSMGRHPIPIRGLDHIVLRVAALDAMTAFYCEVLGCRVERNTVELKGAPYSCA